MSSGNCSVAGIAVIVDIPGVAAEIERAAVQAAAAAAAGAAARIAEAAGNIAEDIRKFGPEVAGLDVFVLDMLDVVDKPAVADSWCSSGSASVR